MIDRKLRDTPISILDFETTGLSARSGARVVEIAVTRIDPGKEPNVVFDTLIDPEGPVFCTSIHGIRDDDVLGAPRFTDLLGDLVLCLEGSVVGAFNASFDISFLKAESQLARKTAGLRIPPYVCLMWLRPLLGLSKRCSLDAACEQHGLRAGTHRAAEDTLACAHMWTHYVAAAERAGCITWSDLSTAGTHKYLSTLSTAPYAQADFEAIGGTKCTTAMKPRQQAIQLPMPLVKELAIARAPAQASRSYWHALIGAFADGRIDREEIGSLRSLQKELKIAENEIRHAHARIFADTIRVCAEDRVISDNEAAKLRELREALLELGWAPG